MITFDQERPADAAAIEALLDLAFGPDRLSKSSYSLREDVAPVARLNMVARHEGRVVGTVRFWPVLIEDMLKGTLDRSLLLGPLAVDPTMQGHGIGADLMSRSLARVVAGGYGRVLLVGDKDYYSRFGFQPVLPRYVTLPGGRDARRLMVRQEASLAPLPAVGRIVSVASAPVDMAPSASARPVYA